VYTQIRYQKKGGGKVKKKNPPVVSLFSVSKYLQMCVYAYKHAHISGKCQDKEIKKKIHMPNSFATAFSGRWKYLDSSATSLNF
jgi:hypothetical protein